MATSFNYTNTKSLEVLKQIFKISFLKQFTHSKVHPFEVYKSVGFSIFTQLYNHPHYLILEQFHHIPPPPIPYPSSGPSPSSPFPQPLATTNLLSVSVHLSILDLNAVL